MTEENAVLGVPINVLPEGPLNVRTRQDAITALHRVSFAVRDCKEANSVLILPIQHRLPSFDMSP